MAVDDFDVFSADNSNANEESRRMVSANAVGNEPVSDEELRQVERMVNSMIRFTPMSFLAERQNIGYTSPSCMP